MTEQLTQDEIFELKNSLYEAQEHMYEALEILERYVEMTGDRNAEAYLVDHFKIMVSRDHGFLSRDLSVDDLIDRLDETEEDGWDEG